MHEKPGSRRLLAAFLILITLLGGLWVGRLVLFSVTPVGPSPAQPQVVEVTKRETPSELTKTLVGLGVVSNGKLFMTLGRITRQWHRIKAGEYQVAASMSPSEVFSVITSGISMAHPVTVREGENMYDLAKELDAKHLVSRERFLQLCKDPHLMALLGKERLPSLEGYFFPDTYFFNRTMSPEEMVKHMVHRFLGYWTPAMEARARELGFTRHQVVTLASMIEKETGAPEERPIISSVFHNRLQKKMRLQSDPTTIYGIWERYDGNLHKTDLAAQNAYNTYAIPALPAGPIGNPGKDAIQAALYPATTDYLFFVSHNDGTHEFTKTWQDHSNAVRKFQLDPKARDGKSWRDRLKKTATSATQPSLAH